MDAGRKCQKCGTPLPEGGGPCLACLLAVGLEQAGESGEGPAASPSDYPSVKAGDVIGAYKLLQQIGEGGMGAVWMAEQTQPYRRVALKLVKLGMDTKQVLARFRAEQQALALMDHPGIAQVFDPGVSTTGRPYFVMELVRGIPITKYCDQEQLSTRARLELTIKVCRAVQHAHQKGVIHRDIKPSNILVTRLDGEAIPKIIDFGIAKASQGKLVDETLFTAFEQFLGTPAYMSPEQAEMNALDVDTRSDIYSLGVLLYELLTGQTPFDSKGLAASGLDEMRRTIRETDPVRPSTRLSHLEEDELTRTARRRGMEAGKLLRLVRGDLDWIVMKCLEKDRNRRYETANGLAMDLGRFLDNQPVVARPPSNIYRFQKLVRRNRTAFSAAALILVSLVMGTHWNSIERSLTHVYQLVRGPEAVIAEVNFTNKRGRYYLAYGYDGNRDLKGRVAEETGAGPKGGSALVARFDSSILSNRVVGPALFLTTIGVSASPDNWINTTNLGAYKLYVTAKTGGLAGNQAHGRVQWQFVRKGGAVLSMSIPATFTTNYNVYSFVLADGYADPYAGGSWDEFTNRFAEIDELTCQLSADDWRGEYRQDIQAAFYVSNVRFVRLTRSTGMEATNRAPVERGVFPTIRVQPTDQTVDEGEEAEFSVLASGTAPLLYQWHHGTSALPGANGSVLTLHHVTAADAGAYSVSITNPMGGVLSRETSLTVRKLHEVTIAEVTFHQREKFYSGVYYYCPEPKPLLTTDSAVTPSGGVENGPALVGAVNGSSLAGRLDIPYAGFGMTIMVAADRRMGIDTTNLGAYKLYVTAKTAGLAGTGASGQVQWWFFTPKGVILNMETPVTFTTNYQVYSFVLRDGAVNPNSGGSMNEFAREFDKIDKIQCTLDADHLLNDYRLDQESVFYVSNVKFVRLVPDSEPSPQVGSPQKGP